MLDVGSHDIGELSESGPNDHIKFVEVEVKDHDLVLMEQLLILVIDDAHHYYCILIMQLILDE